MLMGHDLHGNSSLELPEDVANFHSPSDQRIPTIIFK